MQIRKIVAPAELLPRWYGVAWVDMAQDRAICYPMPLNVLFAFGRNVWLSIKVGSRVGVHINPRDAYLQGLKAGRAQVPSSIEERVVYMNPRAVQVVPPQGFEPFEYTERS